MTSTNKELLLVDLDGVIVNLHGFAWEKGLLVHPACRWDMEGCCLPSNQTLNDLFGKTWLFEGARSIDGYWPGIAKLREVFDVQFVSAPWPTNPTSAGAKARWFAKRFPLSMLTLTTRKDLIPAVALIDDRPGLVGPWEHIMYPQRWNQQAREEMPMKDRPPTWREGLADWVIERLT